MRRPRTYQFWRNWICDKLGLGVGFHKLLLVNSIGDIECLSRTPIMFSHLSCDWKKKMRFADSIKPKCTSNRHNNCLVLSQYKFYGMAIPPLNLHFMRPLTTLFHDKSSNKKQTAYNNRSAVLINFFGSFSRWLQGINQRVN
jgi:hypothetical protein